MNASIGLLNCSGNLSKARTGVEHNSLLRCLEQALKVARTDLAASTSDLHNRASFQLQSRDS